MHLKLQRSVTEILKSVIRRPNLSCSVTFSIARKSKSPIRIGIGRTPANNSGVALLSNPAVLSELLPPMAMFPPDSRTGGSGVSARTLIPDFWDRRDGHGLSPPTGRPGRSLQVESTPAGGLPQMCVNDFWPDNSRKFAQIQYVLSRIDLTRLTVLNC